MLFATSNKAKRLLHVSYVQQLQLEELKQSWDDINGLLAELEPGFRLLVDLSQLESIDPDCAPEMGRLMERIDQCGVEMVVRVVPDPSKDIGLRILTLFHYPRHPQVITCESMAEACRALSL